MTTIYNTSLNAHHDADYSPPAWSNEKVSQVQKRRRDGLYTTQDTIDETITCVGQLKQNKDDKVFTLIQRYGVFSVYNTHEFMTQLKDWKKLKCVMLKCNISEIDCGKEGKATMFIIQPCKKDMDGMPWSPVAMAFGTMVSGFAYVSLDKDLVELAWKYLGSRE